MAQLSDLTRPQRLFLKRAWAATERRPFQALGPKAEVVAKSMVRLNLAEAIRGGFRLTASGHALAVELSQAGWPDCEKEKPTGRKKA